MQRFAWPLNPKPDVQARSASSRRSLASPDERLELILKEYGGWLRKTLERICPRDMGIQPEDVEQEVALRLWRALGKEQEIENPAAFLYRVASTATIDAMRRVRSRRGEMTSAFEETEIEDGAPRIPQPIAPGPSPEKSAVEKQILGHVEDALARLPENRRQAVGLYLQGFKIQEIADFLGWTEPKARNLLYRGLETVRRELAAEGLELEGTGERKSSSNRLDNKVDGETVRGRR